MRTLTRPQRWLAAAVATTAVAGAAAVSGLGQDAGAPVEPARPVAAAPAPDLPDLPPRRPAAARDRTLPPAPASPSAAPQPGPTAAAPREPAAPPPAPRTSAPKPRATPTTAAPKPPPPKPPKPPKPPAPPPAAPAPPAQSASSYEAQLLEGINGERARAGLPALSLAGCPDELAGSHARRMAGSNRLYHQSMDTVLDRCGGSSAGENVGAGNTTPQDLVRRWMASSGHRANILNRSYTAIGVGAARGSDGRWYASTVFHTP